jgi:hypothetical protein
MCKAVDKLTPEQRQLFDTLYKQLARVEVTQQLRIVGALNDYIELTALEQRPYQLLRRALSPTVE